MILHLAPFIFIPHFWHAFSSCEVERWSFSKIADRRVVSSAYLMSIDKLSWNLSVLSRLFSSFMTNSRKILNRVGDNRHPCLRPIFTANHSEVNMQCPKDTPIQCPNSAHSHIRIRNMDPQIERNAQPRGVRNALLKSHTRGDAQR